MELEELAEMPAQDEPWLVDDEPDPAWVDAYEC